MSPFVLLVENKNRKKTKKTCTSCKKLVTGDYKCVMCNQNIHLSCSATPTVDGVGDIFCQTCNLEKAKITCNPCCNEGCSRSESATFECFFCKGNLHKQCFEDETLCSKSCAPKYRAQMIEPCASCQQMVNGDYKCLICDQNIHLSCSAAPTVDGVGDIICRNCNYINEPVHSDNEEKDEAEEYVPPSDKSASSTSDGSATSSTVHGREETIEEDVAPLDISKFLFFH